MDDPEGTLLSVRVTGRTEEDIDVRIWASPTGLAKLATQDPNQFETLMQSVDEAFQKALLIALAEASGLEISR